jgi:hypothetical protein
MEFIVDGLFVWLIIAIISGGYATFSQVRRMTRFMNADSMDDNDITKGFGLTSLAGFVCTIGFILFLVAVAGSLMG